MKNIFRKNTTTENQLLDINEPNKKYTPTDEEEFDSFFSEVLKRFPAKTASIILTSYENSKKMADKIFAQSKHQLEASFNTFLKDVDDQTRK